MLLIACVLFSLFVFGHFLCDWSNLALPQRKVRAIYILIFLGLEALSLALGFSYISRPFLIPISLAYASISIYIYSAMGFWASERIGRNFSALTKSGLPSRFPTTMESLVIAGIIVLLVAYSGLIFRLVPFVWTHPLADGTPYNFRERVLAVLIGIIAAYKEEIMFRFGMQLYIQQKWFPKASASIPIILAAIVWSVFHVGVIEPAWVKSVQILPVGLFLGVLLKRYNVETCIFAHALFNTICFVL